MPPTAYLEEHREYLKLLGRLQLDDQLAGKVDVSGVVQLTLLEAHQQATNWETLGDDLRLAWLRRVFANNLLDEIRRFRTQRRDISRERSLEQAIEHSASHLNWHLLDPKTSPSGKAIRNEQAVRLAKALACLTPAQREAIELHHLQEVPLTDVGQRMNRAEGAVAALIFRGMRRLRELLGDPRGAGE